MTDCRFSKATPIFRSSIRGHRFGAPHLRKELRRATRLLAFVRQYGEVNRADREYSIGRGLAAIRATDSNPDFIYHALQRWRWCLQRVAQGTTFDAVTARHFFQLHVAVPARLGEQAAIARILDAVDTALEQHP